MQSKQSREEDVADRSTPRVISGADGLDSGKRSQTQASDQRRGGTQALSVQNRPATDLLRSEVGNGIKLAFFHI